MSDAVPAGEVLRQLDPQGLLKWRGGFSAAEREEARAEFYVAVLEGRAQWRGEGCVHAWARGVVKFIALNLRRRQKRRRLVEVPAEDATTWRRAAAAEQVEVEADRYFLDRLLARLRPRHRASLELFLAGYSRAEIASALGGSEASVELLHQRARVKLAELAADPGARCLQPVQPRFLETAAIN